MVSRHCCTYRKKTFAASYMLVAAVLLQTLAVTGCYSGAVLLHAPVPQQPAPSVIACVAEELRQDGYAGHGGHVWHSRSGESSLRRGPGWSRL
jgi:hypothetical protein